MEILFLAHRIPFPPDRGDKIRSHHILKALARLAPVHVGCFADDPADRDSESDLAALAASHLLLDRTKTLALAGIEALARGRPLSITAFHDARMARWVSETLRTRPIAGIYLFSGQVAQYVPAEFAGRVIADLVDVDSAKFEAYGAKGRGPRAWMERREGRLLAREEADIARRADATLLVSDAEARLFRERRADPSCRVEAMGNGIDSDLFDPAGITPEPRMADMTGPRLIFTGQMDYAPNVAAVKRAIERIMPAVRTRFPDASLHVVGRNPPPALTAHHGRDGIHIWGRVDDVRPFLAAADMALVPLEIARGVQNKVLEAMSMGLPVVLSSGAATGIPAEDGRDFLVGENDTALAEAVCALAADPVRAKMIGHAARAWIEAHAGWDAALAALPGLMGCNAPGLSDAA
ncbi:sugar transferase (PEP-CTERM/EpsH1 system associated) [Novosphingobium sp. PhB165]|uniref:TIGR03087 family PEP-CTERM/XrtA system glycosyltransferase n=1 Tax=Novosphingobium sp. PhB165 TaxID=2485105 RepID=UPI00104E1057|nr:TIGR03087 family PEP-CTERM/XrtA system glycosyltransferase [Novosphingobium sp. PhB165]TCM22311.1 sugar transferase (PEP-CTERM/EpsH1 system associated) [Novosphingobium sp. PhB165]